MQSRAVVRILSILIPASFRFQELQTISVRLTLFVPNTEPERAVFAEVATTILYGTKRPLQGISTTTCLIAVY